MRLITLLFILTLFSTPAQAQDVAGDLLGRINALRGSLGLPGYSLNGALNVAAQNHANWMARTGSASHYQENGSRPRDRAQAAGYPSNWVSENIYIGTNATVNDAWAFWTTSPIHYAGLTSPNYQDIGIASAYDVNSGTAFVLVFGAPGGLPARSSSGGSSGRSDNGAAAPPTAPPYLGGVDESGNIKHIVQPDDTLGDIALIYGYTWDDIPQMLELNGVENPDTYLLEINSIFLVPPHGGTFTPTPDNSTPTPLPTATATATPVASPTPPPTNTPVPASPTPITPQGLTVVALLPQTPVATGVSVNGNAASATMTPDSGGLVVQPVPAVTATQSSIATATSDVSEPSNTSILPMLIVFQIVILFGASVEFVRRIRR